MVEGWGGKRGKVTVNWPERKGGGAPKILRCPAKVIEVSDDHKYLDGLGKKLQKQQRFDLAYDEKSSGLDVPAEESKSNLRVDSPVEIQSSSSITRGKKKTTRLGEELEKSSGLDVPAEESKSNLRVDSPVEIQSSSSITRGKKKTTRLGEELETSDGTDSSPEDKRRIDKSASQASSITKFSKKKTTRHGDELETSDDTDSLPEDKQRNDKSASQASSITKFSKTKTNRHGDKLEASDGSARVLLRLKQRVLKEESNEINHSPEKLQKSNIISELKAENSLLREELEEAHAKLEIITVVPSIVRKLKELLEEKKVDSPIRMPFAKYAASRPPSVASSSSSSPTSPRPAVSRSPSESPEVPFRPPSFDRDWEVAVNRVLVTDPSRFVGDLLLSKFGKHYLRNHSFKGIRSSHPNSREKSPKPAMPNDTFMCVRYAVRQRFHYDVIRDEKIKNTIKSKLNNCSR